MYVFAKNLADSNVSFNEIEQQLLHKTTDVGLVTEITNQIKKVTLCCKKKKRLD